MSSGLLDARHEASLRALSARPMEGSMVISYQREPAFFASLEGLGDQVQTVGTYYNEKVTAFAVRSTKKLRFKGQIVRFGAIGVLRVAQERQHTLDMARGYLELRNLHVKDPVPGYLVTIVDGNMPAHRVLRKKRPLLPDYQSWGKFFTFSYPISTLNLSHERALARLTRHQPGLHIGDDLELRRSGKDGGQPLALVQAQLPSLFAQAANSREFYPAYVEADFRTGYLSRLGWPGVATNSNSAWVWIVRDGKLVAAACLWDQHEHRQVVVERYSTFLGVVRPLVNRGFKLISLPILPQAGGNLRFAYFSCWSVAGDDPQLFKALLIAAKGLACRMGMDYLMAGFHEKDILRGTAQSIFHITYNSEVFCAVWDEDQRNELSWDGQQAVYLELGTL